MKKRLFSLFLAFVMCLAPVSVVFADEGEDGKKANNGQITIEDVDASLPDGFGDIVGKIINVIKTIGYIVAIIMVMYVGIKYLTAGAGKKAEVKDTLIPILIGAVLLLSAVTLVDWIWGVL